MTDLFKAAEQNEAQAQDDGTQKGANVLSVSQLSNQLRFAIEKQFGRVAVEGEISGLKRAASGHVYFSLKDDDSVLNAIVWRGSVDRIKAPLEDGSQVVAYGKITTYGPRSNYQIIIDRMEVAGVGALMQRFEELKKRLTEEGLFDPARKKPLPFLPRTVGIVTSSTGAVIEDMLNRLRPRYPGHILLWPVAVQGVGAKEQIAAAINGFNNLPANGKIPRPDVLIVARGGGSLEDLWAFNEEIVVRAVAGSSIPVISGVGHEPDVTLCDYAADHRSPTPTAAATEAVPDHNELTRKTDNLRASLVYFIRQKTASERQRLSGLRRGLPDPQSILNQMRLRLDDRHQRLRLGVKSQLRHKANRFEGVKNRLRPETLQRFFRANKTRAGELRQRLESAITRQIALSEKHLQSRWQLLQHLSPKAPLARGYALVMDENGNLVKTANTTAKNVVLHFGDGEREATLKPKT